MKPRDPRTGNRLAATLATLLTVIGHLFLGFEQSWAHVATALLTGYTCALGLEWVDATVNRRPPGFAGGWKKVADFLVSPHMTSITISFLIYTNVRLWVLAFAVACAIGSKYIFRVKNPEGRYVHFLNPSNFGIAATLILFPWVAIIPYAFLEDVHGVVDWIVPVVIVLLGTRLNLLFTKRIPLILSWLFFFMVQAGVRAALGLTPLLAGLSPMTGVAFVLFTFYMITDPMTSPRSPRNQVFFGAALAAAYSVLMVEHIIFTLFYAVLVVTAGRGLVLWVESLLAERQVLGAPAAGAAK